MTAVQRTRGAESPRSKRKLILDAAIDNFGKLGFEQTKWATIADEVGIGQTALYHYFESKAHCLLTIMSTELERSLDRTREVTAGIDDLTEAFRTAVSSAVKVSSNEALQARILLSHQDLLVAPRPSEREEAERLRARKLVREIEAEWASLLRRGMDAGIFPERDEKQMARLVLGLLNSIWRWYRPSGRASLAELSTLVADGCVRLVS
jgi:TetR/AcrR family transcriptional regulator, cholesterol catabolism regulator